MCYNVVYIYRLKIEVRVNNVFLNLQ